MLFTGIKFRNRYYGTGELPKDFWTDASLCCVLSRLSHYVGKRTRLWRNCLKNLVSFSCLSVTMCIFCINQLIDVFIWMLNNIGSPRGDKYLTTAIKCFRRVLSKLSPRSFLLKKILIYIRNLILLSLGGTDHLWKLKSAKCQSYLFWLF